MHPSSEKEILGPGAGGQGYAWGIASAGSLWSLVRQAQGRSSGEGRRCGPEGDGGAGSCQPGWGWGAGVLRHKEPGELELSAGSWEYTRIHPDSVD